MESHLHSQPEQKVDFPVFFKTHLSKKQISRYIDKIQLTSENLTASQKLLDNPSWRSQCPMTQLQPIVNHKIGSAALHICTCSNDKDMQYH